MQTQLLAPTPKTNGNVQIPTGETVCMVYRTHNYNVFKIMSDNRGLNMVHVKRLVQSFQEQYLVCPIIVNEKFEVIDGQHRLHAAHCDQGRKEYIQVRDFMAQFPDF